MRSALGQAKDYFERHAYKKQVINTGVINTVDCTQPLCNCLVADVTRRGNLLWGNCPPSSLPSPTIVIRAIKLDFRYNTGMLSMRRQWRI